MSLIDASHGTRVPEIRIHRGMRLAAARAEAGITQEQMAGLLGCNRRTIGRYEADDTSAPPAVIIAYSVATDVNLGWLQSGVAGRLTPDFEGFARPVNAKAAPSSDEAARTVSTSVRPEGFEPPTFWSVADSNLAAMIGLFLGFRTIVTARDVAPETTVSGSPVLAEVIDIWTAASMSVPFSGSEAA